MHTAKWLVIFSLVFAGFAGSLFAQEEKEKKAKAKDVEVEGVISAVGQRTITFQVERKGKVREEVVGVDENTDIERDGKQSIEKPALGASNKRSARRHPGLATRT